MQQYFVRSTRFQNFLLLQRHSGVVCIFALLLLALAFLGPYAGAQAQNDGIVAGHIKDGKGKAVPFASITLTSQGQAREITLQGNDVGDYVFNSVPVATYTLKVQAPNFEDYIVKELNVHAAETVTINAILKVGSVNVSITVTADSAAIDTQSATVGAIIDHSFVENLPVDGNNVVTMAALLPGVTDVNAPTTFTSNTAGPVYNIAGSRSNQNLMLLDGSIWNNLYNNSGLNFPPSDDLQEVSVQINNFKAEYGRSVGSVFNVITRSGGTAMHGTVWDYLQNRAGNASDYISKENPGLVMNQFGATLGGPLRHNKLFYFASFQDLIMDASAVAQAQTLPWSQRGFENDGVTALPCQTAAYQGLGPCANFSSDVPSNTPQYWVNPVYGKDAAWETVALNAAYAAQNHIYNAPFANSPCVNLLLAQPSYTPITTSSPYRTLQYSEIPSICFNSVSESLLQFTPIPTYSVGGQSLPYAVTSQKQPRNDMSALLRFDWIGRHHIIDARYYQTKANDQTANGVYQGLGISTYNINRNTAGLDFANIGDTWIINNNLLNVARASYKRYNYMVHPPVNASTLSTYGANFTQPGDTLPFVSIYGRQGYNMGSPTNNLHTIDEGIQLDDSLSWSHGKHNIKVGVEFLRLQYLARQHQSAHFSFNSDDDSTDPAMEYTLGLLNTLNVYNGSNMGAIQHDLYSFAQDDWRVLPRLTLNLGIRWEIPYIWKQPDGQAATFIPGFQSVLFPGAPPNLAYVGDGGVKKSLVGTSFNNIAPRFGFSYDLFGNGTTAIRGGFGIFYDANNAQMVGVASPYNYSAYYTQPMGGISNPLLGLTTVPNDYVKGVQPSSFATPYNITYPDKNFRTAYTQAMNIGIQGQLSKSGTLEANYVGRFTRHLALGYDENPAIYDCSGVYYQINPSVYCTNAGTSQASYQARVKYPGFNYGGSGVLDYMSVGFANYNAAQIIYIYRGHKALTITASYTFSKSIDDSSSTGITNTTDQPSLNVHRAVSDFNSTQIFNLGYIIRIPRVKHFIRPARAVINGWGITGMYSVRSGHPFSVYPAGDPSWRNEKPEYLNIVASGYAPLNAHRSRMQKEAEWFNTADVTFPANGTYGDAPRNFLIGPAFISNNLGVMRDFPLSLKGDKRLIFRADAYNLFNTPNLGQPYNSLSSIASKNTNFGVILSTVGNNGAVGTNGRRLQLSGVFRF